MYPYAHSRRYDVIVAGVGGMGSAACYYLARRRKRVLGLERYDVPHEMGSSHGHTRIIRLAYYEDPSYVLLLVRAFELWRAIQARVGEKLLHVTGSVDAGPADSWVFKGALRSALEHDLPHQVLTSEELTDRYPGYRLPREVMALFQPDGGFLLPERCIVSYVEAAHAEGAEIHGREAVLEWQPISDGVRVVTERGTYEADRLVITAGAWNSSLLPILAPFAVPERQVLAWFQPDRPELFTPDRFPVFNLIGDEGRFYGFPVFAIPGFKIGKYHHLEEQGLPESLDHEPHWTDEAVLREFTARHFPEAAGPTMTLRSCMFTNTPDNHFIIDVHPDYPQVSFASACSGHGFKFGSVIGEILADLAERGESRHNIEFFRFDRFTGRSMDRSRVRHTPALDGSGWPRRYGPAGSRAGLAGYGSTGYGSSGYGTTGYGASPAGYRPRPDHRRRLEHRPYDRQLAPGIGARTSATERPYRGGPDGWLGSERASTITEEGLDALRPFW